MTRSSLVIALSWALLSPASAAQGPDSLPSATWTEVPDVAEAVDWTDDIPAHIAVVDGATWHEREGVAQAAETNVALLAGDALRTERGRLEILFADGSALDLDEQTEVELLSDSLLRLAAGRVRLTLARGDADPEYRIDAAGTTTWIRTAGEYEVAVSSPFRTGAQVRLTVVRGVAELSSQYGRSLVRAGYEAVASDGLSPSAPYAASVGSRDTFARWVETQHDARVGYRSAQYLPSNIRHYSGDFDRYGDWQYDGTYGYVWYPTVPVGWRPYYDGHWSFVGSFGWFWVGASHWHWPTHHYGRWGIAANRWYWIPDRHWGPAWVSWAHAPGYVGWSPLGYHNRPLVNISITTINSWNSWTVVPARAFRGNVFVRRHALNLRQVTLPRETRFVTRQTAPIRPTTTRTASRPLRAPTTRAATRTAWPRDANALDRAPGGVRSAGSSVSGGSNAPVRAGVPARTAGSAGATRSTVDQPTRATRQALPRASTAPRVSTPDSAPPAAGPNAPSRAAESGPARVAPAPRITGEAGVSRRTRPADEPARVTRQALPRGSSAPRGSDAPARVAPSRAPEPSAPAPAPRGRVRSAPDRAPAPPQADPPSRGAGRPQAQPRRAPEAPSAAPPPRSSAPDRGPRTSAPSQPQGESGPSNGRPAPSGGDSPTRRAVPRGR